MKNKLNYDQMWDEAVKRLELLKVNPAAVELIAANRSINFKIVVNHEEKSVRKQALTENEIQMIKEHEERLGFICYYLIQDEGIWPDGCTFPRYTLLFVDTNEEEYEWERTETIERCGMVTAYVINMEDQDCSEYSEIMYRNVGGNLINLS